MSPTCCLLLRQRCYCVISAPQDYFPSDCELFLLTRSRMGSPRQVTLQSRCQSFQSQLFALQMCNPIPCHADANQIFPTQSMLEFSRNKMHMWQYITHSWWPKNKNILNLYNFKHSNSTYFCLLESVHTFYIKYWFETWMFALQKAKKYYLNTVACYDKPAMLQTYVRWKRSVFYT